MENMIIRNYQSEDIEQIVNLQKTYSAKYPVVPIRGGLIYNYPEFEGGQNIFCAFDEEGILRGFAPIYPRFAVDQISAEETNTLWTAILPDVNLTEDIQIQVMDLLLHKVKERAQVLKERRPQQKMCLSFTCFSAEEMMSDYLNSRGFDYQASEYNMIRDLHEPFFEFTAPVGVTIRHWKMETEAEQLKYIQADNICFPKSPTTLENLRYFLASPYWEKGTAISAFDENGDVVASVRVYWNEEEVQKQKRKLGFTEDIFVLPAWRDRGLAKYLIQQGFIYLREHGLDLAYLQVVTHNTDALKLYLRLGYKPASEEKIFEMYV